MPLPAEGSTDALTGPAPARSSVVWKRVVGALAAVTVLATVSVLAWTWRHPTAFPEVASDVSVSSDRWLVGEPLFVGMTFPFTQGEKAVTLHGAEANLVANTADAIVSFGICALKPDADGSISSGRAQDIAELCTTWGPIDEHRLTSDTAPLLQLLMKVTPRQGGTVEIAGAKLTYSQGWQRGAQNIGEHLRLRAR